jgi:RNA polymerase sigma factor (sigma-70 family)
MGPEFFGNEFRDDLCKRDRWCVHGCVMDPQAAVVAGADRPVDLPVAFEDFFEAERSRLFRALLLVTHDAAQAEDLTQEAFLRVWERWDRVARTENPVAYLFRTAMNLHRSAIRRALMAATRSLRPGAGRDPFDQVLVREEAFRALSVLTPRQRAAVVVTELLGFSSEEAGVILGIRPGTVRTLASQARITLLGWKDSDDA